MLPQRTKAGLEEARLAGRVGGRKRKLLPHQEQDIRESVQSERRTAAQCARLFDVHPSTITRLLQRQS